MLSSASLGLDFEMILLILLLLLWWCLGVQSCQLNVIQSNPRQYIADIPQVSFPLTHLLHIAVCCM
jgi:hypothetical protein